VIEKRQEKRNERALIRETEQAKAKEELREKIMKKAVSIKKKQIKQQIALDDISSDDEPIESIKKKVAASKAKQINIAKVRVTDTKPNLFTVVFYPDSPDPIYVPVPGDEGFVDQMTKLEIAERSVLSVLNIA
jgi:hypothetical protein